MRIGSLLVCLIAAWFLTGCSSDDSSSGMISIESGRVLELPSVASQSVTVSFQARGEWSATCSADWAVVSPKSGSAGNNTITVTTSKTNRTKNTRSGQLVVTSGSERKPVTLVQMSHYAIFDQHQYTVKAEGGTLSFKFKTNVDSEKLRVRYMEADWIHWEEEARLTRNEWAGETHSITVDRNTSSDSRVALYILSMANQDGEWMGLDTAYVSQSGVVNDYVSTDYSADGHVRVIQRATSGYGIPIVLMGDGFSDREVADGTYDKVMDKAVENMFSEEPIRSLRSYFNVFAVTAVSRNSGVGSEYNTVFSTVPDFTSTSVALDKKKVIEYSKKPDSIKIDNALSVVILNSRSYNGVTLLMSDESTNEPMQYSIAICAMIDGLESEVFRQVLTHEAVGHGFAKLADEYGYEAKGAPDESAVNQIKLLHQYGWMMNVDTSNDPSKVLWHSFIGDSRFANENISVYEGGYTYSLNVWRPTEESMMNHNQSPFNAPSRKAIFDRVMWLGEGKGVSSHEVFSAFDQQHKPTQWSYSSTRGYNKVSSFRMAPPIHDTIKRSAISRGKKAAE